MLSLAYYSGDRGGVGKTTLSVLSAIALSSAGFRVLLVDLGGSGNSSSSSILRRVSPPFLRDLLKGRASWYEVVRRVAIKWGRYTASFYLAPNNGLSACFNLDPLLDMLDAMRSYVDIAVIDLPSDPFGAFIPLVNRNDETAIVANPDEKSVLAVCNLRLETFVIPILNKYTPLSSYYRDYMREKFGLVFTIPFDPVLTDLNPRTLPWVLNNLSREFQRSFTLLLTRAIKPGLKEVTA